VDALQRVGDMKIAVLGASSFSGKAFVAHALELGVEVLQLTRSQGHDLNSGIDLIKNEVSTFKPSHFVNFAALNVVADSWKYFPDYYRMNVIGVANLAEAIRRIDSLEKFVQVSTPEVYGNSISGEINPDERFNPSTPYAVSRAAADMHLQALHRTYGFPVCFTRTVNVYGPGQQPYRIVPKTVLKIARGEKLKLEGGGESRRSFIHVRDMAAGTMLAAQRGKPGLVYHFSTPEVTKIKTLVATICQTLGVDFKASVENVMDRPGKDRMYKLNWRLARHGLDWGPEISLEDGLEETVDWFKAHAEDYKSHSLEYDHRA
jgi:dTDP-glucose 4,6-dehydratase